MRIDPTYNSNKYDDDDGERIVLLFGVNIAKKPTKVDDTPKDSSNMGNINCIPHDSKDISIVEHKNEDENENNEEYEHQSESESESESENDNDNDNDNNEDPMDIDQSANHEKKKVKPWTPEEHMAFLEGLKAVGKSKWKHISKNYVKTKTSTQVASHAQKYFQRIETDPMFRNKRQSIFDMKLLDDESENSKASGGSSSLGPSYGCNSH